MVRTWHPATIPMLDDERLLAQHSEGHMMMRALKRGGGGWFANPETQVFFDHPQWLGYIHDFTVNVMRARNYPSAADHKTPAEYTANSTGLYDEYESNTPGYKSTLIDWLERDYADLYVKWEKENRWDPDGFAILGRRRKVTTEDGSLQLLPQPPKWGTLNPHFKERTHRDFLRPYHDKIGPRDQITYDREGLSKLVALRRRI